MVGLVGRTSGSLGLLASHCPLDDLTKPGQFIHIDTGERRLIEFGKVINAEGLLARTTTLGEVIVALVISNSLTKILRSLGRTLIDRTTEVLNHKLGHILGIDESLRLLTLNPKIGREKIKTPIAMRDILNNLLRIVLSIDRKVIHEHTVRRDAEICTATEEVVDTTPCGENRIASTILRAKRDCLRPTIGR